MLDFGKNAWLLDLAQTLLRSWWTLVAAVCLGLAAGTLALEHLPKKYRATTTVWISHPQLPESVARSTVKEDMTRRLMVFQAAVLSQDYMVELIERTFEMPKTEEGLRSLIVWLRAHVTVENLVSSRRQGFATFALTYRGDDDPQRAAKVINTLTELYISQNTEFRSKQAEKTANTIASMTAAMKPELDEVDSEISRFLDAHRFETEAVLSQNHAVLEEAMNALKLLEPRRTMLDAKIQNLELQLTQAEMRGYAPASSDGGLSQVTPRARRLAELQRELAELRINYSEVHPTYLKKKRELEELLNAPRAAEPAEGEPTQDSGAAADPAVASMQFQIDMAYQEAEALDGEEQRLKQSIAERRRRIAATPSVQKQLNELTVRRDYLRNRHRRLQLEADAAGGSVDLEQEDLLGNRMEVLEYASVPTVPYYPQPLRINAVAVALGCLLFIGPLLARSLLNPVILSEEGFRTVSEHPVLVSIPNCLHSHKTATRRLFKNLALSVASGAVLVAAQLFLVS